eukprot:COSAG01_NODE_48_length_31904_cov_21.696997_26_plen_137_part_00
MEGARPPARPPEADRDAHDKPVIHRDLKSPNLLLSERPPNTPGGEGGAGRYDGGGSFVVKVADFGLSRDKNLTSEGGTAMMTGCGACRRRRISHGRRAFVGAGCRSRVYTPSRVGRPRRAAAPSPRQGRCCGWPRR